MKQHKKKSWKLSLVLIIISQVALVEAISDPIDGRYSFSLTTFDPSGKLPQLAHAVKASTLGPPIIAIRRNSNITNGDSSNDGLEVFLASLQILPSPLISDDGTSRFTKITDSILMGHTGINADGRVIMDAAQRITIEHAYSFQEEIPISILLEELALLYQEFTMKAGVRPFGCSVILVGLEDGIYTIDPSGVVLKEEDDVAFIGKGQGENIVTQLKKKLQEGIKKKDVEDVLIDSLVQAIGKIEVASPSAIIAQLSRNEAAFMKRVTIDDGKNSN